MDKTKCIKYGCGNDRFKGRLCKEHYDRFRESKRNYAKSVDRIFPYVYTDRSKATIR